VSTTNREKRKQAKRKARERSKKNGTNTLRSKHYATGGTVGDWIPDAINPPPPEDGERLRLTVQDPEGLSCDSAKWPLRMLRQMDASVWVATEERGEHPPDGPGPVGAERRGALGALSRWYGAGYRRNRTGDERGAGGRAGAALRPERSTNVTEILEAMTRPDTNGTPALPKRSGPKGLLPSTWLERTLKVAYVDVSGRGVETSGTLLDLYPAGPVLSMGGAKTLICWERLVMCELVED